MSVWECAVNCATLQQRTIALYHLKLTAVTHEGKKPQAWYNSNFPNLMGQWCLDTEGTSRTFDIVSLGASEGQLCSEYKCCAFGALQKERGRDWDRNKWSKTDRGMRVRYVKTLAKASSGMSLKAEHSGRVMMTLESSPRPPGKKGYKQSLLKKKNIEIMSRYAFNKKVLWGQ